MLDKSYAKTFLWRALFLWFYSQFLCNLYIKRLLIFSLILCPTTLLKVFISCMCFLSSFLFLSFYLVWLPFIEQQISTYKWVYSMFVYLSLSCLAWDDFLLFVCFIHLPGNCMTSFSPKAWVILHCANMGEVMGFTGRSGGEAVVQMYKTKQKQ